MNYFLSFLIISLSILFHEAGHLFVGLWTRIPMKQFSVGFGPRLISKTLGHTEYKLSLIPVGGYVLPEIEDMNIFFAIPVWRRMLFTLGGPIMNLLIAWLLLSFAFCTTNGWSFSSCFILPFSQIVALTLAILNGFAQLITQPDQLSGVVGVISAGGQYIQNSWINAITFAALLNINLAIFNLLPLPPLDGGKLISYFLELIDKRLVKLQVPLSIAGWAFLLLLMLYATFQDVSSIIQSVT